MATSRSRVKRVTLSDVAEVAGLSVQTVSHVLSGNMTVRLPQATRKRVLDAADKVGYRPNRHAQAMKSGKTNVVGIWMPLDRPNLAYMSILHLFSQQANGSDKELMISGLNRDSALGTSGQTPTSWPVDGVISVDSGKAIEAFRRDPYNDPTPVSILGYEQVSNSDSVAWDVLGAEHEAVSRLIKKGRKRIVHVTMDWILSDFPRERRRRGYAEAMAEAGLEPVFVGCSEETRSGSSSAISEYVRNHGVPEAITALTDTLALGAASAILASHARIPEDCQIVGFGDYPEVEDFVVPLTSIRPPFPRVIQTAWDWLIERIEDPTIEPRFTEIPMEIIERISTG